MPTLYEADLKRLADAYQGAGTMPIGELERALPADATAEDMELAFEYLAERAIEVIEGPVEAPVAAAAPNEVSSPTPKDAAERILMTPFVSKQLLGSAAGPGPAARSGVFDAGADARELAAVIAGLGSAMEEAENIRQVLGGKRLSEVKRQGLRQALADAQNRARGALAALPISEEWLSRRVEVLLRAAERLEVLKNEAKLRSFEVGNSDPKAVRRVLRETRLNDAQRRELAHRWHTTVEALEALDQAFRVASGERIRIQERVNMPGDALAALVPDLRVWTTAHRRKLTARVAVGARRLAVPGLSVVRDRVEELAARTEFRVEGPAARERRRVSAPARPRRVVYASDHREAASARPGELEETSPADLGNVGESLVFGMMLRRWEASARRAPDSVRGHLLRIADEYWSLGAAVHSALDAVLRKPAESWWSSCLVRDLLWPARTVYGDGLGFDLFGLPEDGPDWLCVEVKTTLGPAATQFELTVNEYQRAKLEGVRYALARVSRVLEAPTVHLWIDPAAMIARGELSLEPSAFTVAVGRLGR